MEYYVKYLEHQPIKIEIDYNGQEKRNRPLKDVADLIVAYKTAVAPLLEGSSIAQLTLHSPDRVPRKTLPKRCFAVSDNTDTTLDPGCSLSTLGNHGSNSKKPLIIKSTKDSGQGILI